LKAWIIYNYVANRMSLENIERYTRDIFNISVSFHTVNRMKSEMSEYYRKTYSRIKRNILAGDIIHVDETKIKLQHEIGYVWVFATHSEVLFMFRNSREGKFLNQLLKNFTGVLISDFFSAYDKIPCLQQKCLVHLIRDMNNHLLKNPYDDELKLITTKFGSLMRNIILTIDRFGLKHRFLKKHQYSVAKFNDFILTTEFSSDLALHYQKRFSKYKDKLFVFLDRDNVNWNNNAAENAIRYLAKWRRLVSGRITVTGINQYCLLLTIYVTCKLRDINYFRFLLSEKRDLDMI
jgi:hypothetical protein